MVVLGRVLFYFPSLVLVSSSRCNPDDIGVISQDKGSGDNAGGHAARCAALWELSRSIWPAFSFVRHSEHPKLSLQTVKFQGAMKEINTTLFLLTKLCAAEVSLILFIIHRT